MNNNPNYKQASIKGAEAVKEKWKNIKKDYRNNNPSFCKQCNAILEYKKRNNKFCSESCSASYNNSGRLITEKHKQTTSNTLKNKYKKGYNKNPNYCKVCNSKLEYNKRKRTTCSKKCFKINATESGKRGGLIGGKISAQVQAEERRSKNEKLFAEYCINKFNKVLTNEAIFNGWDADVIIEDVKVAVLWNGIWHYEKITDAHSVKQVQNRDKIKIKEIKKAGYIPYVIKDMGKFNKKKVKKEFDIFINNLYIS